MNSANVGGLVIASLAITLITAALVLGSAPCDSEWTMSPSCQDIAKELVRQNNWEPSNPSAD